MSLAPPPANPGHSIAVMQTRKVSSISVPILISHERLTACYMQDTSCDAGNKPLKLPKEVEKGPISTSEVSYLPPKWAPEPFVKGDRCGDFYKEKWSRPRHAVRSLCVHFLPKAGR